MADTINIVVDSNTSWVQHTSDTSGYFQNVTLDDVWFAVSAAEPAAAFQGHIMQYKEREVFTTVTVWFRTMKENSRVVIALTEE